MHTEKMEKEIQKFMVDPERESKKERGFLVTLVFFVLCYFQRDLLLYVASLLPEDGVGPLLLPVFLLAYVALFLTLMIATANFVEKGTLPSLITRTGLSATLNP